ncbi:MFS transporter [Actinotalea sp.]|uniref:MFS transporter n=1 Tax=Actinotalea sp. TaxID=1872145 RepID=UPI00356B01FF
MSRLLDVLVPPRLGTGFRWLLASSWTSNLGDGIALAAGPLLVASLTDDARLIALAATVQWLPPLLFGLLAGALADRHDRRTIVVAVDLARAFVLAVLVTVVVTGHVTIAIALLALFVVATAEVFADNSSQTMLPNLVARDDIAIANARLSTGFITVNQLAGPPLGAALFAVGWALPFSAQALAVALGAVLMTRVLVQRPVREQVPARLRSDIAEGFRWTMHHAAIRTLVLTIFVFNITFGAAWSVLVLYSSERLGLGPVGFGLVTTTSAVGGLVGTTLYGALTRRISLGGLMRIGLVLETLTHLALALTTSPWVGLPVFFVFGVHAFVWGATSTTVRQRAVPPALQGRVGSVNLVGVFGGLVIGSGLGGVIAHRWGVTGPFWFAFVGSAVFLAILWRQMAHIAHDAPLLGTPDQR